MPWIDPQTPELPFQSGSETSHEAAVKASKFVGRQGERVWEWFWDRPEGATQREASEALGISRASVCARVRALELAGRLVKTVRRRNACSVYQAVR